MKKKIVFLIIGSTVAVLAAYLLNSEAGKNSSAVKKIIRPEKGADAEETELEVLYHKGGEDWSGTLQFKIFPREYNEKELQEKFEFCRKYLEENLFREGESASGVTTGLNLQTSVPDIPITINWLIEDNRFILEDGSLNPEREKVSKLVGISAELNIQGKKELWQTAVKVLPPVISEQDKIQGKLKEEIAVREQNTRKESTIQLPEVIENYSLTYQTNKKDAAELYLFIFLSIIVVVIILKRGKVKREAENRKQLLLNTYPEMVYRFVLLFGAGVTILGVWRRLVAEYEQHLIENGLNSPLYEEMKITRNDMENGKSEEMAYEEFGRRICLIPYIRFSSILTQNLKLGSKEALKKMEDETAQAMEDRKKRAMEEGEKAGTKLLLPMLLMLILVIGIIMVPAFMGM